MTNDAIAIRGLEKRYGDIVAVDGLDLEVKEGEVFGLLGPNGAGKTTTISILCGLQEPTAGSVTVAGFPVPGAIAQVRERIGVCPQEMAVFPYLTGRENVELFGRLYGMTKDAVKARSDRLLDRLGLTQDADRRVKGYSGGMKRRVSLAASLVSDPPIAFLDEPTTGMDPQSRRAVWEFLRELGSNHHTILLTTHYMEEAEYLCHRVAVIDHGKLIALGTPKDLMKQNGVGSLEDVFLKLTGRRIREGA